MDELRFVLKCFGFAALLLVLSQLKTNTGTIETDIQAALVNSKTAEFVNMAADGGVKAIRSFVSYAKETYNKDHSEAKKELENKKATLQEVAIKKIELLTEKAQKTEVKNSTPKAILVEGEEFVEEIE
jgi:signal recognition particle GTPase